MINKSVPFFEFHVYLKPPTSKEIGTGHNLLTDATQSTLAATPASLAELQTAVQELLDYANNITTGDELMFTMDVPYIPVQDAPIVLAQTAAPAAGSTPQPDFILKDCQQTESTGDPRSAMRAVDPAYLLHNYLAPKYDIDLAAVKTALMEDTTHGKITTVVDNLGRTWYRYDPEPNYVGNDRAVFMAEFMGKRFKIVLNLVVSLVVDEHPLMDGEKPVCPPPQLIKVNGKPVSGSSGYDLNSIAVTFADLTDGAVGQTTGTNITLDTNAANYNWFIDTTPADNSEYLPTSNPYEWVAKAGTDAYGKMDMLTVLLHEYGNALGIEHSADNHDYMATTLTAGVRRMPSADELALMQQLIAQAKDGLVGRDTPTDSTPGNTPNPFPTLPFGTTLSLAFLGRLRSSRYGDLSIAPDYATLTTKYTVAANATFTNLNTPGGWNTQGSATFNPDTPDPSTGSGRTASVTLERPQYRSRIIFRGAHVGLNRYCAG